MKIRMTAFILLAGLATAPAAFGQDHSRDDAGMDAPDRACMMKIHEGQSMMNQAGMMQMHKGSSMMILRQKEALGLDASQIERLEGLADQMAEMRRAQMESMKNLHADALAVLTDEQRSSVEDDMRGMMENGMAMQGKKQGMPCSMMGANKGKEVD